MPIYIYVSQGKYLEFYRQFKYLEYVKRIIKFTAPEVCRHFYRGTPIFV